jgi:hypothetical protein
MTKNYTNRDGDVFTFTRLDSSTILWEGPFEYTRVSNKLDYTESFRTFKEDFPESTLTLEQFKSKVYACAWNDTGKTYIIGNKYRSLITPIENEYKMVDPMGGPYIAVGSSLDTIIDSGIVSSIVKITTGYELKVKPFDR